MVKKFAKTLHANNPEPLLTMQQYNNLVRADGAMMHIIKDEVTKQLSDSDLQSLAPDMQRIINLLALSMHQALCNPRDENPHPETLSELRQRFKTAQDHLPEFFLANNTGLDETAVGVMQTALGQVALRVENIMTQAHPSTAQHSHVRH